MPSAASRTIAPSTSEVPMTTSSGTTCKISDTTCTMPSPVMFTLRQRTRPDRRAGSTKELAETSRSAQPRVVPG